MSIWIIRLPQQEREILVCLLIILLEYCNAQCLIFLCRFSQSIYIYTIIWIKQGRVIEQISVLRTHNDCWQPGQADLVCTNICACNIEDCIFANVNFAYFQEPVYLYLGNSTVTELQARGILGIKPRSGPH